MFSSTEKELFLFLILCLPISLFAQSKATLSGYIEDAQTGEKLIAAVVYDARSQAAVSTNTYGFYSLRLDADSVDLRVQMLGYQEQQILFVLRKDSSLNISLSEFGEDIDAVEVEVQRQEGIEQQVQMSRIELSAKTIKAMPALLGEVDVLRSMQLLPGIQSGEASSGIYVRGGSPDQNLILLDGVPVYNAYHLFGFFSVFNADAIKNVQLTKGGYPARFGGRLSSVLEINLKEGNSKKFSGQGSIGLISSKFSLEGPIIKDKTAFIVSARRTYIDALINPIISLSQTGQEGSFMPRYFFYDFNAKINHKFNNKHRLFLSAYAGKDLFGLRLRESYRDPQAQEERTNRLNQSLSWGNITSSLRWNYLINDKLFANTTLSYTRYRFDLGISIEERVRNAQGENSSSFSARYQSLIEDFALRMDFDYLPNPRHYLRFGWQAVRQGFEPGAIVLKLENTSIDEENGLEIIGNNRIPASSFSVYAEDDIRLSSKLRANIGVHASGFLVKGRFYPSVQPRLALRYLLPQNWALKASFATMQQAIHLLTNEGIGLPTDLWVPSTENIAPEESWQAALGIAKTLFEDYELSVELYYRDMRNLISYRPGASFIDPASPWEDKVESGGVGQAYGAEFFLQRKFGKLSGWIAYTLAWNWRKFPNSDINGGRVYPFKYDRRHDIALVGIYEFNERISFSGTWVFGTGNAITLPVERFVLPGQFGGIEIEGYGEKNNYRMAPYHRLDFSIDIKKKREKWESSWSFGAYNVYSRRNPFFIYAGIDERSGERAYKQVSLFPFIPSIRWNFSF